MNFERNKIIFVSGTTYPNGLASTNRTKGLLRELSRNCWSTKVYCLSATKYPTGNEGGGTTWSPKGETPVIVRTGKRFRLNMISSITNRGKLQFMVFKHSFTASVFIDFMARVIRYNRKKVFLIVDGHPTHKAKVVKEWLEGKKERIELFFLPAYSPELNPDELVNQDVKTNAVGKHRTLNVEQLKVRVENFLVNRKKKPKQVIKYFHGKYVKYAS